MSVKGREGCGEKGGRVIIEKHNREKKKGGKKKRREEEEKRKMMKITGKGEKGRDRDSWQTTL